MELVRHNSVSERSEELVVDTQRAVVVEVVTERSSGAGPARIPSPSGLLPTEHALGFLSALVLFLVILALALLYSARMRSRHHLAEKLLPPEEHNFYRGKCRQEAEEGSARAPGCPLDKRTSCSLLITAPLHTVRD